MGVAFDRKEVVERERQSTSEGGEGKASLPEERGRRGGEEGDGEKSFDVST